MDSNRGTVFYVCSVSRLFNEEHLRLLGSLERLFSGDEQEVGVRWQPIGDLVHKSKN